MKLVKVNHPSCYTNSGFDNLMKEFFNEGSSFDRYGRNELNANPLSNVYETEDSFRLELALPGYEKEQISLAVENNSLIVKGEKPKEEEKEYKYVRREFSNSDFEKSFRLSKKINQEAIKASFKNGILELVLPKKEEAIPVKRQIDVA